MPLGNGSVVDGILDADQPYFGYLKGTAMTGTEILAIIALVVLVIVAGDILKNSADD